FLVGGRAPLRLLLVQADIDAGAGEQQRGLRPREAASDDVDRAHRALLYARAAGGKRNQPAVCCGAPGAASRSRRSAAEPVLAARVRSSQVWRVGRRVGGGTRPDCGALIAANSIPSAASSSPAPALRCPAPEPRAGTRTPCRGRR